MEWMRAELGPLTTMEPQKNIVRLDGICDSGERTKRDGSKQQVIYCVQEICTGGELFNFVALGRFNDDMIRHMARQLLGGVKHMYDRNFVHRDLKPENVVVSGDGSFTLKIIDFGFAKALEPGQLTKTYYGSGSYMAPEIIAQEEYDAHKADMFSLGVFLFVLKLMDYPWTKAFRQRSRFAYFVQGLHDKFWQARID